MKLNTEKTQLLCMTGRGGEETRTYIETANSKIFSDKTLKIVDFTFGEHPDASAHLQNLKRCFNKRLWAIRHLKRSGFDTEDLLDVYETMIRPIIVFTCVVYGPMIGKTEEANLERLQNRVPRLIYGTHVAKDYRSLRERRDRLFEKFVKKNIGNIRFKDRWLKEKDLTHTEQGTKKNMKLGGHEQRE